MTRTEIESTYTVSPHGVICDLGKFEGEMLYAPYFYDAVMNGCGERVGDADFFVLDDEDKAQFPELQDAYGVTFCESEQGFVYVRAHDKTAYELLLKEAEESDCAECE